MDRLVTVHQYNLTHKRDDFGMGEVSMAVTLASHILTDGRVIYSINGENKPEIKTFDFEGNLMQSQDLSELEIFSERLTQKPKGGVKISGTKNIRQTASGRVVVRDAQLIQEKLYMLIPRLSEKDSDRVLFNTVLVFEKTGTEWKPTKQIQLSEEGTYMTFRVYDGGKKLVTFDRINGNIETFDIDRL